MEQQRIGIVLAAGTDRACHGRGDAAAESAIRHHRHQHEDWKYQRYAGKRIGPEKADIIGLGDVDRGLRHQHDNGRQREP
jgi:hypothetical protein